MPAGTNKNVAFIAFIAALVPCLIGLWFALPVFLPMYLWTKVDLRAMAVTTGIPEAKLSTRFKMRVRYEPRGEGDPVPWQIIDMSPPFNEVYPEVEDESKVLVRCTMLSANDGEAPSTTFINNTYKDRYFTLEGLRLPPGSLGRNAKRPVVVYDSMSRSTMDITKADMTRTEIKDWENDDFWEARDDGYDPPGAAP